MHATHYGTSKRSYTFDMYKLRYEGKVLLSFHFFKIIPVKLFTKHKNAKIETNDSTNC